MSVTRNQEYTLSWMNLDESTAVNLYLYGTLTTPEDLYDRIYPEEYSGGAFGGPRVLLDATDYMASGPGRYATAALAPAIEEFFLNTRNIPIAAGTYTRAQIQELYGYESVDENGDPTNDGFSFRITQYKMDTGTGDYDQRTFVYSTGGYIVPNDASLLFVVDTNGERRVENLRILPLDDDFDFTSSNPLVQVDNDLNSLPLIDPYRIGKTVELKFFNKDAVPVTSAYDSVDFLDELADYREKSNGSAFDGYGVGSRVREQLEDQSVFEYKIDDFNVVFGKPEGEEIKIGFDFDFNDKELILGGGGIDDIDAGAGDDRIYGHEGNDIIKGGRGRDRLFGGSGNDDLDGGNDDDTLYGDYSQENYRGAEEPNGTAGNDTLKGGRGSDKLYGGEGSDDLDGGADDDRLYHNSEDVSADDGSPDILRGGEGKDLYFAGDGDTVVDADGSGSVVFNGIRLTGGKTKPDDDNQSGCEDSGGSNHESEDEDVYHGSHEETYRKSGNDLIVEYQGASLTIKNWNDDDLGITLKDKGSQDGSAGDDCGDDKNPPDNFGSPLVLDLDGDGLELIALEDSVAFFDIDRDGVAERTGWAGPDDGLLAIDANLNGVIDGAGELFGYGETFSGRRGEEPDADRLLGPGDLDTRYSSGFAQLAAYDSNDDGFIDAGDAQFSSLRIWRDLNGDGETDEGELTSLADAGVASISLAVTTGEFESAGNLVTDFGSYTTTEGATREISDVWFRFDQYDSKFAEPDSLDPDLLDLPDVPGNGAVKSLRLAMAENPALRALVEQLDGLTAADLGKASPLIDAILYEWAAVSHPDLATGRGAYADQRSVAVMEAFADTDFAQWSGPNPRPMAGGVLADQYNTTALLFAARLIAQTDLGQTLFPELTYENNQFLVLQSGVDSATVLQRLIDSAPSDVNAALAHYQAGLRLMDTVYLSFEDVKLAADDGAGYIASVETVLQNAGIDLDYMSLVAARIGGDGDDSFLTESFNSSMYASKTPVISGGLGDDDIVLGGNRQIVYWGTGQGSDTIEIDPFSSQGWSLTPRVELRLIGVDSDDVVFERSARTAFFASSPPAKPSRSAISLMPKASRRVSLSSATVKPSPSPSSWMKSLRSLKRALRAMTSSFSTRPAQRSMAERAMTS